MFEKLVAIEPVSLIPSAEEELHRYAKEVVLYRDVPASADEMVRRIGDSDAVLLSYTSLMGKEVIAQCPNIRYIGMCCSLYSEESANVDIAYARTRGIQVLGIRDYGDRGVVEYVLHELTGLLHLSLIHILLVLHIEDIVLPTVSSVMVWMGCSVSPRNRKKLLPLAA